MIMDEDPIRLEMVDEWEEPEDTAQCNACRCYFIPDVLIKTDDDVTICMDCINLDLDKAEQGRAEVLLLEDKNSK